MNHSLIGDHGPLAVMQNGRQIAGAVRDRAAGQGQVSWTAPYNAPLPCVKVWGEGRQDRLKGTNILPFPFAYKPGQEGWSAGITFTFLQDGGVHLKGTLDTGDSAFLLLAEMDLGTEKISTTRGLDHATNGLYSVSKYMFYRPSDKKVFVNVFKDGASGFYVNETVYPQVTVGPDFLPYEPYCGGIPAPNPQYPIEPQFLEGASVSDGVHTAHLPILRALPDGSVRDEMDVVSGTVTRRIGEEVFDGSSDENWKPYLWDRGAKGWYIAINQSPIRYSMDFYCNALPKNKAAGSGAPCVYLANREIDVVYTELYDKGESEFRKWLSKVRLRVVFPLTSPVIEHYDPAILRQHPGYTQLIQQGGFRSAAIDAEYWKEMV